MAATRHADVERAPTLSPVDGLRISYASGRSVTESTSSTARLAAWRVLSSLISMFIFFTYLSADLSIPFPLLVRSPTLSPSLPVACTCKLLPPSTQCLQIKAYGDSHYISFKSSLDEI